MPARTNVISTPGLPPVPTPAPLFLTRRGQLPYLPRELLHLALPPSQGPLLLQLPLLDWHTLNPNAGLHGADLLSSLSERAGTLPDASAGQYKQAYSGGIAGYCGQPDAVLFLCNRAAGSDQLVTDTAGKSTNVTATGGSRRCAIAPGDVAALHETFGTRYMTAAADSMSLPSRSEKAVRRRVARGEKQLAETLARGAARGVLASVGGGDVAEVRREAARAARATEAVEGYSIDGLYAGESGEARWRCVAAAVGELGERGLRVLGGGHGGPGEVVGAVQCGVDVVESAFPFEQAACGYATDVRGGARVNCRDRAWLREKGGLVKGCACGVCRGVSRAYVRHLFEVHEMCAVSLVAAHNLWDYLSWFEEVREAVRGGEAELGRFVDAWEKRRVMQRAGVEAR